MIFDAFQILAVANRHVSVMSKCHHIPRASSTRKCHNKIRLPVFEHFTISNHPGCFSVFRPIGSELDMCNALPFAIVSPCPCSMICPGSATLYYYEFAIVKTPYQFKRFKNAPSTYIFAPTAHKHSIGIRIRPHICSFLYPYILPTEMRYQILADFHQPVVEHDIDRCSQI